MHIRSKKKKTAKNLEAKQEDDHKYTFGEKLNYARQFPFESHQPFRRRQKATSILMYYFLKLVVNQNHANSVTEVQFKWQNEQNSIKSQKI